jgi:hypothetical protein
VIGLTIPRSPNEYGRGAGSRWDRWRPRGPSNVQAGALDAAPCTSGAQNFGAARGGRPKRFAHFLIVGILALGADWQHEDCIGLAELEPGLLSVITGPQAVEVARALVLGVAIAAMHSRRCGSTLGRLSFDAKGDVAGLAPFAWSGWTDGTYVPHDITDW